MHTHKGIGPGDMDGGHPVRLELLKGHWTSCEGHLQVATGNCVAIHTGQERGVEQLLVSGEGRGKEGGYLGR